MRKSTMKKVTLIDYQIMDLERRISSISEKEKEKLLNLKMQKQAMKDQGITLKATIVPRFPPYSSLSKVSSNVPKSLNVETLKNKNLDKTVIIDEESSFVTSEVKDVSKEGITETVKNNKSGRNIKLIAKNKEPKSRGGSSAYIKFLSSKKKELNQTENGSKLDVSVLKDTWKHMSQSEKEVYKKMSDRDRKVLGGKVRNDPKTNTLSEIEKKLRKKKADKQYKQKLKEESKENIKKLNTLEEMLKEITSSKEAKLEMSRKNVEKLKSDLGKTQTSRKEAVVRLVDKDMELVVLKEKYKTLHKIHKTCGKGDAEVE